MAKVRCIRCAATFVLIGLFFMVNARTFVGAASAQTTDRMPNLLDIRAYGAKCDGVADDRNAIEAAIAAGAQYHTPVQLYIPDSTVCLIGSTPNRGQIFSIAATNIGFSGHGTIRIGDHIGPYRTLFAFNRGTADTIFEDITIDGNAANNPVDANPIGSNERQAIQLNGATSLNVVFRHMHFINGNDVQTIAANQCNRCTITANTWSNYGTGGTYNHDSSEIYLTGIDGEVTNNTFDASGLGVRTAIEVHQDHKLVKGNVVNRYNTCIIVSPNQPTVHGVTVEKNSCNNVYRGIQLWASDGGYDGLQIIDNEIHTSRAGLWKTVAGDESPIAFYPSGTHLLKDILIARNRISSTGDSLPANNEQAGIALVSAAGSFPLVDVTIENNEIDSSLCTGILVQNNAEITNLIISANTITNPGQNKATKTCYRDVYKTGIAVFTSPGKVITGSTVRGNRINDNQPLPTMRTGLYFYGHSGDGAATGMLYTDNTVGYAKEPDGSPYAIFHDTVPQFHLTVPDYRAGMSIFRGMATNLPPGSTISDPVRRTTYTVRMGGRFDHDAPR
jgi:hypothetical protein